MALLVRLASDLTVDEEYDQRTNHRDDKAAEIKTVDPAKAEESTNPTPDNCTDDTENYGNDTVSYTHLTLPTN